MMNQTINNPLGSGFRMTRAGFPQLPPLPNLFPVGEVERSEGEGLQVYPERAPLLTRIILNVWPEKVAAGVSLPTRRAARALSARHSRMRAVL
jgi:hypothetical protein